MTHQRSYGRALAALGAGAVLVLGLGACGGDDDGESADDTTSDATTSGTSADGAAGSGTGAAGGSAVAYEITGFEYSDLSAPAGGVVEVGNSSGGAHTFTADDGAFDVPVAEGESVPVDVPAEAGEYPFHCEIHPDMAATLTVG